MPESAAEQSGPAGPATLPAPRSRAPRAALRTRTLFAGAGLVVFGLVALMPWMLWDERELEAR